MYLTCKPIAGPSVQGLWFRAKVKLAIRGLGFQGLGVYAGDFGP